MKLHMMYAQMSQNQRPNYSIVLSVKLLNFYYTEHYPIDSRTKYKMSSLLTISFEFGSLVEPIDLLEETEHDFVTQGPLKRGIQCMMLQE